MSESKSSKMNMSSSKYGEDDEEMSKLSKSSFTQS